MVRHTAAAWLVLGLGACFTGNFLSGQPCAADADCGPQLKCEQGFCGGPPPGSSSSTTSLGMSSSTVPTSSTSLDESTSAASTSGSSSGEPASTSSPDNTTGPTCGYGRCTDLDLVVVVDNSPSMIDKNDALLTALVSFQKFIQPELVQACSVHLAVTTTDAAYKYNPVECQKPGALVQRDFDGNECVTAEGHPYATLEDLDDLAPLLCLIRVGADGSGDERPIESMFELFNSTLNGADKCNEGFVRTGAQMVIVMVTDEDDDDSDAQGNGGSIQPEVIWHSGLVAVKPEADLLMIGLLGDEDPNTTMCPWDPLVPPDGAGAETQPNLRTFFGEFAEDHRVLGPLCMPDVATYDAVMLEVQTKLRAMCDVP